MVQGDSYRTGKIPTPHIPQTPHLRSLAHRARMGKVMSLATERTRAGLRKRAGRIIANSRPLLATAPGVKIEDYRVPTRYEPQGDDCIISWFVLPFANA